MYMYMYMYMYIVYTVYYLLKNSVSEESENIFLVEMHVKLKLL